MHAGHVWSYCTRLKLRSAANPKPQVTQTPAPLMALRTTYQRYPVHRTNILRQFDGGQLLDYPAVLAGELQELAAQFYNHCPGELRAACQEQFGDLLRELPLGEDLA